MPVITVRLPIDDRPWPDWTPRFGDRLLNVFAGETNPTRIGIFVRVKRVRGRMNAGTWWELTDGQGKFWDADPRALDPAPPAEGGGSEGS